MRTLTHMLLALSVLMIGVVGAAPEASALTVEVRSIAADQQGKPYIDPRLGDLKGQLQSRGFSAYKSFKLVDTKTVQLPEQRPGQVTLVNGDTLALTFEGKDGKLAKLRLVILCKLDTRLRVSPGSTFFQAGLRHGSATLILAIVVRP